jgi:hypothetical protein
MRSPAPRYPALRNVRDGRSPGFSDRELREREEGERLPPTAADKPGVGPLAWPARGAHGPLRRARCPVPSPTRHGLGIFASNREANA